MKHPIHRKTTPLMTALKEKAPEATELAMRMQATIPDGTSRLLAVLAAGRLLAHCIWSAGETEDEMGWTNWVAACLLMLTRLTREEYEIHRAAEAGGTANAVRGAIH